MADYYVNLSAGYGSGAGTQASPWSVAAFDRNSGSHQISDAGTNNRTVKAGDRVFVTGSLFRWQGLSFEGVGGNGPDCERIDQCDLETGINYQNYIQIIGQGALVSAANWGNIFIGHQSKYLRLTGFEVIQNQQFREGGTNCNDAAGSQSNPAQGVNNSDMVLISSNAGIAHHIIVDNNHLHDFPDGTGINVTLHPNNQLGWDFVRIEENHVHHGAEYDYRGGQGITALRGGNVGGCGAGMAKLVVWRNWVHDIVQLVNSTAIGLPFPSDGHAFLFGGFQGGKNGKMLVEWNIAHDTGAPGIGVIAGFDTDWVVNNNTVVNCGWFTSGYSGNIQGRRLDACIDSPPAQYTDRGAISFTTWEGPTSSSELCNNLVWQDNPNVNHGYDAEGPTSVGFGTAGNNWAYGATANNMPGVINQSGTPPIVRPTSSSPNACGTSDTAAVYGAGKATATSSCVDFYGESAADMPVGACAKESVVSVDQCVDMPLQVWCAGEAIDPLWFLPLGQGQGGYQIQNATLPPGITFSSPGLTLNGTPTTVGSGTILFRVTGDTGWCSIPYEVRDCVDCEPCDQELPSQCENVSWSLNLTSYGYVGPFTIQQGSFWDGALSSTGVWSGLDTQGAGGGKVMPFVDGNGCPCTVKFAVIECNTGGDCTPTAQSQSIVCNGAGNQICGQMNVTVDSGCSCTWTWTNTPPATAGTFVGNSDGSYCFTPAASFTGTLQVSAEVCCS